MLLRTYQKCHTSFIHFSMPKKNLLTLFKTNYIFKNFSNHPSNLPFSSTFQDKLYFQGLFHPPTAPTPHFQVLFTANFKDSFTSTFKTKSIFSRTYPFQRALHFQELFKPMQTLCKALCDLTSKHVDTNLRSVGSWEESPSNLSIIAAGESVDCKKLCISLLSPEKSYKFTLNEYIVVPIFGPKMFFHA